MLPEPKRSGTLPEPAGFPETELPAELPESSARLPESKRSDTLPEPAGFPESKRPVMLPEPAAGLPEPKRSGTLPEPAGFPEPKLPAELPESSAMLSEPPAGFVSRMPGSCAVKCCQEPGRDFENGILETASVSVKAEMQNRQPVHVLMARFLLRAACFWVPGAWRNVFFRMCMIKPHFLWRSVSG